MHLAYDHWWSCVLSHKPAVNSNSKFKFKFLIVSTATHLRGRAILTIFLPWKITKWLPFFFMVSPAFVTIKKYVHTNPCFPFSNHHWITTFRGYAIVLFHNYFSPSGEQPEQYILAYKSEQPTAGCLAIFHKYCWYIKHGSIITNLTLWNPWGYVTDMSKYHNAGIWSMN